MPWTCTICARKGDREGTVNNRRMCYRTGVATMKGYVLCCNCMRATGWESYAECGCQNCHRLARATLQEGSDRRKQVEDLVRAAFSTLPSTPQAQERPVFPAPRVNIAAIRSFQNLAVFEFDNVLFRTPKRPAWWSFRAYHGMMESLLPPLVPFAPDEGWFDPHMLQKAKEAFNDANTWSVLVTFRGDSFRQRVLQLLRTQGVEFNEVRFRALRPFLSQLGQTQEAEAGYGELEGHLQKQPGHAQDKHMLTNVGHILSRGYVLSPSPTSLVSGREVDLWLCGNKDNDRAQKVRACLRSSKSRSLCVRSVVSRPHPAPDLTQEELERMQSKIRSKVLSLSGVFVPVGYSSSGLRLRKGAAMQTILESSSANQSYARSMAKLPNKPAPALALWPAELYWAHGGNSQWKWGNHFPRTTKIHWQRDARAEDPWVVEGGVRWEDEDLDSDCESARVECAWSDDEGELGWEAEAEACGMRMVGHSWDCIPGYYQEEQAASGWRAASLKPEDDDSQSWSMVSDSFSEVSGTAYSHGVASVTSEWMAAEDDVMSLSSYRSSTGSVLSLSSFWPRTELQDSAEDWSSDGWDSGGDEEQQYAEEHELLQAQKQALGDEQTALEYCLMVSMEGSDAESRHQADSATEHAHDPTAFTLADSAWSSGTASDSEITAPQLERASFLHALLQPARHHQCPTPARRTAQCKPAHSAKPVRCPSEEEENAQEDAMDSNEFRRHFGAEKKALRYSDRCRRYARVLFTEQQRGRLGWLDGDQPDESGWKYCSMHTLRRNQCRQAANLHASRHRGSRFTDPVAVWLH